MEPFEKICKLSRTAVYSQLFHLGKQATDKGAAFKRIHRYHFQITYQEQIVDIKVNLLDYEFFVLLNGNVKKAATTIHDIEMWMNANLFNSRETPLN